jgi:hypothetical protein
VLLILTSAYLTAGASAKATNAASALDLAKSATFSPFRRPDYSVHVMISGDQEMDLEILPVEVVGPQRNAALLPRSSICNLVGSLRKRSGCKV